MRSSLAPRVFIVGMPPDILKKARECFETINGIIITGTVDDVTEKTDTAGAHVVICCAESGSKMYRRAKPFADEGDYVIACYLGCDPETTVTDNVVDSFMAFPAGQTPRQLEQRLTRLVYIVRSVRLKAHAASFSKPVSQEVRKIGRPVELIAIGASAGGTHAIERIISNFPKNFPCVLIVQHMACGFTELFISSLRSRCSMPVSCARTGDGIAPGRVYVAPWGKHMRVVDDGGLKVVLDDGERISGHKPSVDALFDSVASAVGANAIGVILTGMGKDGASGLLRMREAGSLTIGQDKQSCMVYGMPMEAYNKGAVMKQLPLDMITDEIKRALLT